ncbi:TonB-dependent receptor [Brevundimonas sp. PAMC22021]|uniref:TonB-dependent receptor n=1 Tax=Brevundimonas sp. PAMC22021 TaxID=2861285 RepID=UPI001C629810|nr:TonB-dependent receptor [Brevundimonas sp. PAMC22021]QYF85811.1 TonB-dependent receptor [Brevundimonas sp. PAMC22021]
MSISRYFGARRFRLGAAALAGTSLMALAAAVQAGEVRGRVIDANTGALLEGAALQILENGRQSTSDRSGGFAVADLAAGQYTVIARYTGYQPVTQTVVVDQDGVVPIELRLGGELTGTELGDIVVTGARAAQARALQVKRTAPTIIEALSADDVGKLPDANAADAVQRLPGVSISIDQGEGRYVIVRGVDSNLNNVTVNGQIFPGPEGGSRRVALDTFPSDIISRVEIVKALTPDMDANAVGGSINLVTASAFDRPGGFGYGSATVGYNDKSGNTPYSANLSWGRLFGSADQFGVVLGLSHSFRDYESDTIEGGGYRPVNGQILPDSQVFRDYSIERQRTGVVANFEWKPNDEWRLFANNTFTRYADDEERDSLTVQYALGTLTNATPTSGQYSGGRGTIELRSRKVVQTLYNLSAGARYAAGPWTLDLNGVYADAAEDTPRRIDWEFRSATNAFPNTYSASGPFLDIRSPNLQDPARYPFRRVRRRTDDVQEDTYSLGFDLRYDLDQASNFLKAGARYVQRDKSWDRQNTNFTGTRTPFLLSAVSGRGPDDFFDDRFSFGPVVDFPAAEAVFRDNLANFIPDPATTVTDSLVTDFDVEEKVAAGYGMASAELRGVTVIAGVRVEHTDADYSAYDLQRLGGVLTGTPLRDGGTRYTNVLPSVHLRAEPMEDLVLRAAWSNTIGRPNYTDIVPRRDFNFDETSAGVFRGSISEGNPDLKPFESMNLDFSAEYYLTPAGIISLGLFYKDIENPIYNRTIDQTNTTIDGQFFSLLTTTRPENAASGTIRGIELNYQQQFTSLPSPFDGLGLSANGTLTGSSTELFGRTDDIPFFRQSDTLGNVALFYEKYGLSARLALAHRSGYLEALNAPGLDLYVADRNQLDFKASYRLREGIEVFGSILNINDEPLETYLGDESRVSSREIYSWSASAGVSFRF